MKPAIDYIQQCFSDYNRLYFNNQLPIIPIVLSNAKTFMRQLSYRIRRPFLAKNEYYDFRLKISQQFDYDEQELKDTILHEMIHYYIAYNNINDTSTHGRVFRNIMNDLNTKYGHLITISHKSTLEERLRLAGTKPTKRVFAVIELTNGKTCIKVVPRSVHHIKEMSRRLDRAQQVLSYKWYFSTDPFFNMFPSSVSNRLSVVNYEELQLHLSNAVPITDIL